MSYDLYSKILFDPKKSYLVRLHFTVPKSSTGKFGEFYFTYIDVWEANSNSKEDIEEMIIGYENGSSPRQHIFSVSWSFMHMWEALNLRKNSLFLLEIFFNVNQQTQQRYPYYKIKVLGPNSDNKVHSTLDFMHKSPKELNLEIERKGVSHEDMVFGPVKPKILEVNPDAYTLFKSCLEKSIEMADETQFEKATGADIVFIAKTLYHDTLRRGWTMERTIVEEKKGKEEDE